jgi:hydroxyethylthiazole kinase-like uncharacterized protein yjeF
MKKQQNTPHKWLQNFPFKKKNSHKYSRGQLIVVGGKKEMIGATLLSAEAALRTGVGSVKIICDKQTLPIYSLKFPSLLKKEINNFKEFKNFVLKNKSATFLIGPGAGANSATKKKTTFLLKIIKNVILDADAITSFKYDQKTIYKLLDKNKIITPHVKEFKTIFPKFNYIKKNELKIINASKLIDCTIVLKGSTTYISNRKKIITNNNSTKELAVIGSGDVLSGIISSLVGKNKLNCFDASCAGVWLHSEIGKKSGIGLIAEDLLKELKPVLKKLYGKFIKQRNRKKS